MRRGLVVLVSSVSLLLTGCATRQPRFRLPAIVLWAWERPEDLRFIDPHTTGVAFLAATAQIAPDGAISFHPRTQSLLLPDGVRSIAVVRIESPVPPVGLRPDIMLPPQPDMLVAALKQIVASPEVRGLQIDFDARLSEREFYRTVIRHLRQATDKPIGMTALASWCSGDRWLDREPIAEAVPMFFRMGRNETKNMSVNSAVCRSSIGLSMDEPWPATRPHAVDRVYIFNPRPWTPPDYLAALRRIELW